jgi:hypothetical protein
MNIYQAAAKIDASDCKVYILQGKKNAFKILIDQKNKLHAMELVEDSIPLIDVPLWYISTVSHFTLMPNLSIEQLPTEAIAEFLKWNSSTELSIIKNPLLFDNISILFQISKSTFTKSLPAANFKHGIEVLVNQCMLSNQKDSLTTVLWDNQLILNVLKDGKLQLSNIFQVENNEEVIYYIMLMFQELSLDFEKVIVQIYGECEETPFLEKNLSGFVRNVTSHIHPFISNMKYSGIAKFIETIQ